MKVEPLKMFNIVFTKYVLNFSFGKGCCRHPTSPFPWVCLWLWV